MTLRRYWGYKIWVCGKNSVLLWWNIKSKKPENWLTWQYLALIHFQTHSEHFHPKIHSNSGEISFNDYNKCKMLTLTQDIQTKQTNKRNFMEKRKIFAFLRSEGNAKKMHNFWRSRSSFTVYFWIKIRTVNLIIFLIRLITVSNIHSLKKM